MRNALLLSVVIPVYNRDSRNLLSNLYLQAEATGIPFELIAADDCSAPEYRVLYSGFNPGPNYQFVPLTENLGRARIRNFLAETARGKYLLFLDCDTALPDKRFIARYLQLLQPASIPPVNAATPLPPDAVYGGWMYEAQPPEPDKRLRWAYGRLREELPAAERSRRPFDKLMINNFLIRRSLMLEHPLDPSFRTYGHEDTLFGYELRDAGVSLLHINNPVLHIGLEGNAAFLLKTRQAVANFYKITSEQAGGRESALYKSFAVLRALHLLVPFSFMFRLLIRALERNLQGPSPRIWLMDFYKLGFMAAEALAEKEKTSEK